jgi:membrane protein
VSLGVVAGLFALIFRLLPDVRLAWRNVWLGAIVTAILFTIGKGLLALYIRVAGVGSAHGAAGSLVIVLVWVYDSSQILFFGAELTRAFTEVVRPPAEPARHAVRVRELAHT